MEKRTAAGADLVIPLAAIAFTAYFFVSIAGLEWEAKANGLFVGVLLIVLAAAQLLRTGFAIAKGRASASFAQLLTPREALWKRLSMLAITILFVATVPWLGVGLGLFLGLSAGFWSMGVRGPGRVLLVAGIIAAVCTGLFTFALDTGLPRGPVENAILHFAH